VDALHQTGKHTQALALGRTLVSEARGVGYRPLLANLLERLWSFEAADAFPNEAIKDLEEAVWLALASRLDDVAARAAATLSGLTGYTLARREDGERWAAFATAILDRLGPGHDLIRSWVLETQHGMALLAGDFDGALRYAREGLALKERVLPPGSADVANSLNCVAEALYRRGDLPEALAMNARATAGFAAAYGEASPWMGKVLSNRGEYLVAAGRLSEGIASFTKSLALWEPQLGPDHPFLAFPLTGLGVAYWKAGRPEEARPVLERALRIREAKEHDAGTIAETRLALGRALWDGGGDQARARRLVEQARAVYDSQRSSARPALEARAWLADHPRRPQSG
jgi:tetratricopeptide (TPR) repeat protein